MEKKKKTDEKEKELLLGRIDRVLEQTTQSLSKLEKEQKILRTVLEHVARDGTFR